MVLYDFNCKPCHLTIEIEKQVSESYVPECPGCHKPMTQVYTAPLIKAGVLDKRNLPK